MNNIILAKYINGNTTVSMSEADYDRLSQTRLKGCPFEGYSAYDLLRDLLSMYSWKMQAGIYYTIGEFLTLCNNVKADVYRSIFTED